MLALHICVGDRGRAFLFDSWLSRNDVETQCVADALAACVQLLRCPDRVPDLVLLGSDWFGPEELLLSRYVHETWPAAVLLIYGPRRDNSQIDNSPLSVRIDSTAHQSAVLSASPARLIQQTLARAPESPNGDVENAEGHPDNTRDNLATSGPNPASGAEHRPPPARGAEKHRSRG